MIKSPVLSGNNCKGPAIRPAEFAVQRGGLLDPYFVLRRLALRSALLIYTLYCYNESDKLEFNKPKIGIRKESKATMAGLEYTDDGFLLLLS